MSSKSNTGLSTISALPGALENGDLQSTRRMVTKRSPPAEVPADRLSDGGGDAVECVTVVLVSVAYLFAIESTAIVWYVLNAELLLGTLVTIGPLLCLLIAINAKQLRVACVHAALAFFLGILTLSQAVYEAIPLVDAVDALVTKQRSSAVTTCFRFAALLAFESLLIALVVMVALLRLYRVDRHRDRATMRVDTATDTLRLKRKRGRERRKARNRRAATSVIPETKFI